MTTLRLETLPVIKKVLFRPQLEEVVSVLNNELPSYFQEVTCEVVDCPDLSQEPFTLACKGLCGDSRIIDIGGPQYLVPMIKREKLYDLKDIARVVEATDPVYITGAGAGPWPFNNVDSEAVYNLCITDGTVSSQTYYTAQENGRLKVDCYPSTESRLFMMGNLYASNGQTGKVLQIKCKKRTGDDDFISSIRKSLAHHYKTKLIGLGGVFLLNQGKAKQHVIVPKIPSVPIKSFDELYKKYLTLSEMSAPLIALGTIVTRDQGLDIRLQHFHSFSKHNQGGHYHNDTTPDLAEYIGYFNLGEYIYRIDKPTEKLAFDIYEKGKSTV